MNRVQLKIKCKTQLHGNIGMLFVCLLITWVLSNSVPGLASLIVAATFNAWNKHDFSWFDA